MPKFDKCPVQLHTCNSRKTRPLGTGPCCCSVKNKPLFLPVNWKKEQWFAGIKELGFIFSSHPLAVCGRAGQLRVSLRVSRPRADWGRKLKQIKDNERRREANRGKRAREDIQTDATIGARLRGGVGPPPLEFFIGLRGPKCIEWQHAWKLCCIFCLCTCTPVAHTKSPSASPPPLPTARGLVGWQPAVGGPTTCGGLINQLSQWRANRAQPIHEYFLVWSRAVHSARQLRH